jgi:hypothetical protein
MTIYISEVSLNDNFDFASLLPNNASHFSERMRSRIDHVIVGKPFAVGLEGSHFVNEVCVPCTAKQLYVSVPHRRGERHRSRSLIS